MKNRDFIVDFFASSVFNLSVVLWYVLLFLIPIKQMYTFGSSSDFFYLENWQNKRIDGNYMSTV